MPKKAKKKKIKTKKVKKPSIKSNLQEINKKFYDAVYNNKLDEVIKALKEGANVNTEINGRTPLLILCGYGGYIDIAKVLIEHGADVNYRKPGQETPLTYACMYGHLEIVELLLNAGADVNKQGGYNRTPLMYAAAYADQPKFKKMLKLLLEKGADPNLKTEADDNALMEILWKEKVDPEAVQLLIDHGLDIEFMSRKYYHVTALMRAANLGHFEAVKVLIEKGANISIRSKGNETALSNAIQSSKKNKSQIIKYLIDHGADVNDTTSYGDTSLIRACEDGEIELIKYLIAKGADINQKGSLGATPLHEAARNGHLEIVKLLIENGAEISAKGYGNETPLFKAARGGYLQIMKLFLENGADIEAKDSRDNTPLMFAAWEGKTQAIELLLDQGAEIHAKNNLNWNALMQACEQGHHEAAHLLIERGSDLDVVEKEHGMTPLMVAAHVGSEEIVKVLLEKGVDKEIQDIDGLTAIDYARRERKPWIVKIFGEENEPKVKEKLDLHDLSRDIIECVTWYWGFDSEYNYSASIYDTHILWYLEFDKQWSDPDEKAIQSLDDFLKNGPPGDFRTGCDSNKIRKIVRKAKKQAEEKAKKLKKKKKKTKKVKKSRKIRKPKNPKHKKTLDWLWDAKESLQDLIQLYEEEGQDSNILTELEKEFLSITVYNYEKALEFEEIEEVNVILAVLYRLNLLEDLEEEKRADWKKQLFGLLKDLAV